MPQPNGDKMNADKTPWILLGESYSGTSRFHYYTVWTIRLLLKFHVCFNGFLILSNVFFYIFILWAAWWLFIGIMLLVSEGSLSEKQPFHHIPDTSFIRRFNVLDYGGVRMLQ